MDQSKLDAARILRAKGQTVAEISPTLGVGRSTLYRAWGLPEPARSV
jgi:transposase-like protein